MSTLFEELKRGIITENPLLVLVLGLCPSLAISTSVQNALGMGLAVLFVLTCSNAIISIVKNFIPDSIRIPSYIVVIATFVTVAELIMQAYAPVLHKQLGIFVPLIVVNCIILGRAEAYASKNNLYKSILDGIGIGAGFTVSLLILSLLREILGSNKLYGLNLIPGYEPMLIFILAPGGFFTLAFVLAIVRLLSRRKAA